jgi:DNA mismatch repair protein MSH2
MDEGAKLVSEFMKAWASQTGAATSDADGDVAMNGDGTEDEVAALKQCYEEFRPRIEQNAWCQFVLTSL